MPDKALLKKEIGLFTLVALGVGGMIGSGIFALPAVMSATAGPALLLAIAGAGIVAIVLAMPYSELGAAFPITGGPYSLPRLAIGDLGGFVMGWGYFLYAFIGTAAIIQIFVVYLGTWIPGLSEGETLTWFGTGVALVALWAFTAINVFGVKWGGIFGVVTTAGRLIPLAIFVVWALTLFKGDNFTPFAPFGLEGVTLAITLFFWSYTGFEAIVIPAEEVKKPARTVPLAMLLTLVIAIGVYLLVAFSWIGMVDWKGMGLRVGDWAAIGQMGAPLADVAKKMTLPVLAIIVTIGAVIATGGAGGDWVLFQGRIPYAMAQDKLFWRPMGHVSERYRTPAKALIFTSVLTSVVLVLVKGFPAVASMAVITVVVPYAAAALAVPIMRRTLSDVPRPFRLPVPFVITGIGFVFASWLVYWAQWPWTMVGAVLMLIGYPGFLLVRLTNIEWGRNMWLVVYLFGLVVVSLIGDPRFAKANFTNVMPLGWLRMPWDIVVLGVFALAIFIWAYFLNTRPGLAVPGISSDNEEEHGTVIADVG